MLRLRDGQGALWDEFRPPEVRVLSDELTAIVTLPADARFLAPFSKRLMSNVGRPTIPMETYLRLMYLKHRYSMGHETLVKEVADSLSWRRFCRIRLDDHVPHSTTLITLTKHCGPEIIDDLNATLLRTAVERKVLRSRRLRWTPTEADVRYPTDSGLSAHAVSRLAQAVTRVKSAGLATRTRLRTRRRKVGKIIRKVSHALSGRPMDRHAAIDKLTADVHRLVMATSKEVAGVIRNARRALWTGHPNGEKQVQHLEREMALAQLPIDQTARRLTVERVIADPLVSLSDPDARPIRRGKPQQPTEFGYKVSIADTPEGFVVSHQVYRGNPADAQTLEAAIGGAQDIGMNVASVFAERGYGDAVGDTALAVRGITDSVIPRKGNAYPKQHTRAWRGRYRWRAGAEGRISALKRGHGLRQTRPKGYRGARIWTGFGVLTSNIDRFVALP